MLLPLHKEGFMEKFIIAFVLAGCIPVMICVQPLLKYLIRKVLDEQRISQCLNNAIPINDRNYLEIVDEIKLKMDIKKRISLSLLPMEKYQNCCVYEKEDEICIVFMKSIYKEFKGVIAHELAHIHLGHSNKYHEKNDRAKMFNAFFFSAYFVMAAVYALLMNYIKVGWLFIFFAATGLLCFNLYLFCSIYPKRRRQEMQADLLAAEVVGTNEFLGTLVKLDNKRRSWVGRLKDKCLFFTHDHPAIHERIRLLSSYDSADKIRLG